MYMYKIISLLFLLFFAQLSFAQPEGAEVEWKEGKKYYVHIVQAGNTLYGLTKLYAVDAESILAENPGLESGLKVGQKLLIPVKADAKKEEGTSNKTHVVQKSETVFGISKKYDISMEELIQLNPGIENGVSVGQELKLPVKAAVKKEEKSSNTVPTTNTNVTFSDSLIEHTVLDHETMYSISKRFMVPVERIQEVNGMKNTRIKAGDVLKIPLKKEKITKVEIRQVQPVITRKVDENLLFSKKNKYTIVYLMPFNFSRGKDALTDIATEFYMGVQLAIDSLEKLGFQADIHILDAPSDSIKFKQVLQQKIVQQADLIVGPFMGKNLNIISTWSKNNKVRWINPILAQTDVLEGNPYATNAVTSDITLMKASAKYLVKNRSKDQIVLVKPSEKDMSLYLAFREQFLKLSDKGTKQKLIETDIASMGTYIQKGGNTFFVMPSQEKSTTLRFFNALNKEATKAGNGTISVFGMKEWLNFDDIKGYYKNKYNFHYASSNDLNYSYTATKKVGLEFRKRFNSDMSKFSVQGFDVTFYFLNKLFLTENDTKGIMNQISLGGTGLGNGKENKSCVILKQENFELIQLEEIHD